MSYKEEFLASYHGKKSRSSELPDVSCLLVAVGFSLFVCFVLLCFQYLPRQWNTTYYLSDSVKKRTEDSITGQDTKNSHFGYFIPLNFGWTTLTVTSLGKQLPSYPQAHTHRQTTIWRMSAVTPLRISPLKYVLNNEEWFSKFR